MLLVWGLKIFERFQECPHHESRQAIYVEKPLEMAGVGHQIWWGRIQQGSENSVSHVDGDSDTVPTHELCGERLIKGTMDSANSSVQKKVVPPALMYNSVPPCMSLLPLHPPLQLLP